MEESNLFIKSEEMKTKILCCLHCGSKNTQAAIKNFVDRFTSGQLQTIHMTCNDCKSLISANIGGFKH